MIGENIYLLYGRLFYGVGVYLKFLINLIVRNLIRTMYFVIFKMYAFLYLDINIKNKITKKKIRYFNTAEVSIHKDKHQKRDWLYK